MDYAAIEALEWLSGEEPLPTSLSSISKIVTDSNLPPTRQGILKKMATDENSTSSDEGLRSLYPSPVYLHM